MTLADPGRSDNARDADGVVSDIRRLEQQLDEAQRLRDDALREVREVKSSMRYRVGGVITLPPRALRWLKQRAAGQSRKHLRRTSAALSVADETKRPLPLRAAEGALVPERVAHPDVSVVIPIYNSAIWLDDCLSSVLAQSGVSLEVICINDGSTDSSAAVLDRWASSDGRVTVINQANQGQSVGRNAGLDAAQGRYLIYLDSDDFWPQDTLAELVAKADRDELDVLLFDCFSFLDGGIPESTWKRYSTYYQRSHEYGVVRAGAQMIADMRRNRDYRPHVGMYLARTAFVRDSGARFIPGIVHQDNPYTFALLLNAARVAHVRADIYARRMRPGSTITTLNNVRSVTGYFLSYVSMIREIQGREYEGDESALIADVVEGVFDGAAKRVPLLSREEFADVAGLDSRLDAQVVVQRLLQRRNRRPEQ